MVTLSVIVPVYKTEKYLKRCVDSLINQTLRDIEIILVDDGSPDTCPELCDSFSEVDDRIRVIHKKNGGLSSARNAGMKIACGRYVGFVDSDDDINEEMFEKMTCIGDKEDVDFVMCDYKRILKNERSYLKTLEIDSGKYDRDKIKSDIFPSLIMGSDLEYGPLLSVWHCIYRKSFLDQYNLSFSEEIKWSEDNLFSAFAGYYASSFYYLKGEALYNYYQNPGTITTSYRKGAWTVYLKMNELLVQFFKPIKGNDFTQQLKWHLIYYACNCLSQTSYLDGKTQRKEISSIVHNSNLIEAFKAVDLKNVNWKLRLQLFLMKNRQVDLLCLMIRRRNKRA